MAKVTIKNLVKSFSKMEIIKNINLEIKEGEFVALVGPSGCGKTTTLKILSGLLYPDSGQIFLNNKEITKLPTEKRDITMVFQDYLLFPHLTIGENISFGLKMQGIPKKIRQQKVQELLELVCLPGLEKRYPNQLSGGQQQRIALARVLALEPKVLLLDEPLSNLDPNLREDMRDIILQIHKKCNMTTILVTHDQSEAMLLADRIAVMIEGKIIQYDIPLNLYNQPANKKVANMFGYCNVLEGSIEDTTFLCCGMEFEIPPNFENGEVEAYVRLEHLMISSEEEGDFSGVILEKRFIGGQSILKIVSPLGTITAAVRNYLNLQVGAKVHIKVDWSRVWFQKKVVA